MEQELKSVKDTLLQVASRLERMESIQDPNSDEYPPIEQNGGQPSQTSGSNIQPGPSRSNIQSGPSGTNIQRGPSRSNTQSGPSGTNIQPGPSRTSIGIHSNRQGSSGLAACLSPSLVNITQMKQVKEHKRLFSFGSGTGKAQSGRRGKEKKRQTCTLKFVALSEVHALKPPTKIKDRTALMNSGLGEASIQFYIDMNAVQCHEKILEKFPKFKVTGYEMLLYQRGEDSGFVRMEGAHTPQWLKDAAGNAKIYLRPLQKDLELGDDEDEEDLQIQMDSPEVKCLECGNSIPMVKMNNHIAEAHPYDMHAIKRQRTLESFVVPSDGEEDVEGCKSIQSTCIGTSSQRLFLEELCPTAYPEEIDAALSASDGDANTAAETLLGMENADAETTNSYSIPDGLNDDDEVYDASEAVTKFREEVVDNNSPRQLFTVSRMEGPEELQREIMVCYKSKANNLRARPRVLFEGEEGAGSGPVREFLLTAIKTIDEGMRLGLKPTIFFEGQKDHRLPVHDHALRITGSFKAIGKIIGHSALHNGPSVHGISPAVVHYLCNHFKETDETPPPLSIDDIPDTDLRECILELDHIESSNDIPVSLKCRLEPYLFEAGLDPANKDHKFMVQGLMLYNIVSKRKLEIDDIYKGMQEVKLVHYMSKWPVLARLVFPRDNERQLNVNEFKNKILFEERSENEECANFLDQYLEMIEERQEDGAGLMDFCSFWTGMIMLPSSVNHEKMLVKFDSSIDLPIVETCFMSMTLPSKHKSFEEFARHMDIAVKYGCKGFTFS